MENSPNASSRYLHGVKVFSGACLVLFGGLVSLGFVFVLSVYVISRFEGYPPMPGMIVLFLVWLMLGGGPLALGTLLLKKSAASPGAFRRPSFQRLLFGVMLLLLTVGADTQWGPSNWHAPFRKEKLPGNLAENLQATLVSAHLETEILPGTNVLWCGTFQLAWNEACDLTGGDLRFDQNHPMVAALNRSAFTKDSLDADSYVALSGFVQNNIHQRIQSAIEQKFQGAFAPRFVPDKMITPRPQDLVAYACLYKNLTFSLPFEKLEESLEFKAARIHAFGFNAFKPSHEELYPQVSILDYQSEDDFVIELKNRSEGDRIILAKIQPRGSLADTVTLMRDRVTAGKPQAAVRGDVLIVPRMSFDITRRYSEIENRRLIPKNTKLPKDLSLLSAVQNTRFEMNEKGVELRSEAHMAFGCSAREVPVPKHRMIFDKPFLVVLERVGAKTPYFALWVDNPELLVTW